MPSQFTAKRYTRLGKTGLYVIFFFFCKVTCAQQFYVGTSYGQLNLVTLTANGAIYQSIPGCNGSSNFSIAILNNKIFYADAYGSLYSGEITGTPASITNCKTLASGVFANSLTVDKNGVLYYAIYNQLYTIDPNSPTPAPVFLGSMPFSATGDLVFYHDELYMAAGEGIVQVKLKDPTQSTLYIPSTAQAIYGLANISVNGTDEIIALSSGLSSTELLEVDMQNKLIKSGIATLPFSVFDAGSVTEAGAVPSIEITNTNITEECSVFNKAHVEIVTAAHTSHYTYTLNTGEVNITGIFDNLSPGTYGLTITSDGEELNKITSFVVPDVSLTAPAIMQTLKNPICDVPGQIKLDAGDGNSIYTIQYNGATFGFDHTFAGLTAGTYHFEILNATGCIVNERDYTLQQDVCPPITVNNVAIEPECDVFGKGKVTVTTQAHPDDYTYTLNGQSNATGIFDLIPPGTYNLVIVSSADRVEQTITIPDYTLNRPHLNYTIKNVACAVPGEIRFSAADDSGNAVSVRYGSQVFPISQVVTGLSAGLNSFSILNQQGCIIDELSVNIPQDPCEPIVFPNTFTPNNDGVNDIFRPNQNADPHSYQIFLYDRWGTQLFKSQSIFKGWDGTYHGKPVAVGVYYWVASYSMADGKPLTQSGYVALLR